ncbi:thiamine transporter 1-like [Rhagoletis pomonella]|uniref:thiamine transporter 1-like n=1 Tax=Rhagoletis pomonella TaxID=28610 RepID=UPI0017806FC3|nr:thiamine transporter 1-like [Rhagoletis pomonella]XP_036328966.1 thiamine transporter 1-like [Rhagoletis pomonella]
MQAWLRISLLLWIFGFFREFRPSEPFVTEYLSGPWHNITAEQVNKEIYPFGTYAVLAQLAIVFLITDILRYKPIIIVSACSGIILFGILLWTYKVWELQVGQVLYGTFMATEVAYYTYIYAKVDKERYQIVTGHTRSAILCGKFLGGVVAQVLVSTEVMDYRGLNYISFGSQIVSLFIAVLLPPVGKSLYFYVDEVSYPTTEQKNDNSRSSQLEAFPQNGSAAAIPTAASDISLTTSPRFSWNNAFQLLTKQIVSAYTNRTVIRWSFWWALATCGQVQVISYVQFLWKDIDPRNESFYNGAIEAIVTLLGAGSAMVAGIANTSHHKKWHMWILTVCSLLMGVFTIYSSQTNFVWMAYIMYILFGICYFFVITTASAIVAENLSEDSFGLIFGINTLAALVLQSILTLVVVTDTGYGLKPREQFFVYGCYFIVLAIMYFVAVLMRLLFRKLRCCGNGVVNITSYN